jgi:hypothetical protein
MVISIQDNLTSLNTVLGQYQKLSGLSAKDVLSKQGGKLAWNMFNRLKAIMPAKKRPTADVMASIAAKRGVRIRPETREQVNRANFLRSAGLIKRKEKLVKYASAKRTITFGQQLVKREIGRRESGRGFLAISARYPRKLGVEHAATTKQGYRLSESSMLLGENTQRLNITWLGSGGNLAKSAAEGVAKPKGVQAINAAIDETRKDILDYVQRKQMETVTNAFRVIVK